MKETIKASISGYAFTFNSDAYDLLNTYLDNLRNYYGSKSEGQEIIEDIEARMSELLQLQASKTEDVITYADAKHIIQIMGNPKEFDDSYDETIDDKQKEKANTDTLHIKKRLYRDGDHSIIGGVCSGLGQYFRIDPVIIRIIYVVSLILSEYITDRFSGALFLAYFILWIAMPKAKTMAQKIAMTGKNTSIESIATEGIQDSKIRGKKIGNTLSKISKTAIFIVACIVLIPLAIATIIELAFPYSSHYIPIIDLLEVSGLYTNAVLATLMAIWLIPVFMILYFAIRLISKIKTRDIIVLGIAFIIWIGSCCSLGITLIKLSKDYNKQVDYVHQLTPEAQFDTVFVKLDKDLLDSEEIDNVLQLHKINNMPKSWFVTPGITVKKSNLYKDIQVEIEKTAFGKNHSQAKTKAEVLNNEAYIDSSNIFIKPHIYNKSNIWDREVINITIYCPEDKEIILDEFLEKGLATNIFSKKLIENQD